MTLSVGDTAHLAAKALQLFVLLAKEGPPLTTVMLQPMA